MSFLNTKFELNIEKSRIIARSFQLKLFIDGIIRGNNIISPRKSEFLTKSTGHLKIMTLNNCLLKENYQGHHYLHSTHVGSKYSFNVDIIVQTFKKIINHESV